MKYRTKSTVIEATQWFPGIKIAGVTEHESGEHATCVNIHGQTPKIVPGDYVIFEVDKEGVVHHSPCRKKIFEEMCEEVPAS